LKRYIKKRAKIIRNAIGGNFHEDMKEMDVDKFFSNKQMNKK
jgi:hypothetical protein